MSERPPVDRAITNAYGELAIWQAERIFGLGDRETESPTFGCFDRNYWHYKLTDTPNARAQETALYLAMLYLLKVPYNPFAEKKKLLDWASGAIEFWALIQERNGSFNAFWPHERSFEATAFSTWTMVETVQLLAFDPPREQLVKAAHWLAKHDSPYASHLKAAAILSLDWTGRFLDEKRFVDAGRKKMLDLLQEQDGQGVFPEHGGFDLGLQTITLTLLTLYVRRTRDEQGYDGIMKAVKLIEHTMRDGTFSERTMTRRTQFFYPLPFVLLQREKVLRRHLEAVSNRRALNPAWLDDRYCMQLATNYLQTAYEVFRVCS